MEQYKHGAARVIPVLLSRSLWSGTPFSGLQALPHGGLPVVEWKPIKAGFVDVAEGVHEVVRSLSKASRELETTGVTTEIIVVSRGSPDHVDLKDLEKYLRQIGVDVERLTISVYRGSVRIVIRGDAKELGRIVNDLSDPGAQQAFPLHRRLVSITYIQDQREYHIPVEKRSLVQIVSDAVRSVPAKTYVFGVAVSAMALTIIAGSQTDYRVAIVGTMIMLALMSGLVISSSLADNLTTRSRRWALMFQSSLVILIAAFSLLVFTSYFFSYPRPLNAYLRTLRPEILPSPSPTPTVIAGVVGITVIEVPPYDPVGGTSSHGYIAGRVSGVNTRDFKVVIYSFTTRWYVQPTTAKSRTEINPDGTWEATIQLGSKYAALLVPSEYNPPDKTSRPPTRMPGVVTAVEFEGKK